MKANLFYATLFVIALILTGCSYGIKHPLVDKDSDVPRTKSIIVMRVDWVEEYNDTEDEKIKMLFSRELLNRKAKIEKALKENGQPDLKKPLHYIANFRFQFAAEDEENHLITRFGRDLREYEEIALHEFVTGRILLKKIIVDHYKLDQQQMGSSDMERWKRHQAEYPENYGSWNMEPGTVVYLGHLTLYFKTKRIVTGLLTPEEVVDRIELVRITLRDGFEETKKILQKEKPWFPAHEMKNESFSREWVYGEKRTEAKTPEKPQAPKRDTKKSFF
ncbi:MAG: hypothetical protein GY866_21740 [Proteobacteria bacterium]|nr:hypothetical protein [Pseudomonadota bacterium]